MFKKIKQWLNPQNKIINDHKSDIDLDKDIILINIAIDTKTEEIGLFLDVHPYNIDDKRMVSQAEKFAHGLYLLCGDKAYFTKLILNNIEKIKKTSTEYSMFLDNVIFFWNHYLDHKHTDNNNDPLIKPSKVFKNL
jgi:hypothetical protein